MKRSLSDASSSARYGTFDGLKNKKSLIVRLVVNSETAASFHPHHLQLRLQTFLNTP